MTRSSLATCSLDVGPAPACLCQDHDLSMALRMQAIRAPTWGGLGRLVEQCDRCFGLLHSWRQTLLPLCITHAACPLN